MITFREYAQNRDQELAEQAPGQPLFRANFGRMATPRNRFRSIQQQNIDRNPDLYRRANVDNTTRLRAGVEDSLGHNLNVSNDPAQVNRTAQRMRGTIDMMRAHRLKQLRRQPPVE